MEGNTPELNNSGVYLFNLFIDGEFYPVKVNELIPSKDNDYTYARSKNNEIYIPLMEKVWAKVNES